MRLQVTLDNRPLRHTYVSWDPEFGNPVVAVTDGDGRAELRGVDRSARIEVRVHARNPAIRMLDGTALFGQEIGMRFRNATDRSVLKINGRHKVAPHFRIMDTCYDVYETVFRPVPPFTSSSRRAYPFGGRQNDAADELARRAPASCRFPESIMPSKVAWVNPHEAFTGSPLMYLKSQKSDARLFGTAKRKATLIPHEFAHTVHFGSLSLVRRKELAGRYMAWILGEVTSGRSGTHRTDKATDPLVAFVESIGIFSQRFYFFAKEVRPDLQGATLRKAFVDDELSEDRALARVLPGAEAVGVRSADGKVAAHLTGANVEGAVYGAIFIDLGSRIGLHRVVSMFLRSGALDVDDFARHVRKQNKGKYAKDMRAVAKTWGL